MIATRTSIKSAVDRAASRLADSRTHTPRLDAEVLMAFVLGWPRPRLYAHWDEELSPDLSSRFEACVERRAAGEPVAYIRRLKEFFGLEFYVDERVLVPRPETEQLVARALDNIPLASQRARLGEGTSVVADIGTGSGAMAVSILEHRPRTRLFATDISAGALAVASLNAQRHGASPIFLQGNLLDPLPEPLDLLVANLPYLSAEEMELFHGTSIDFEPRLALTDEADGLRLFEAFFRQLPAKLARGGKVLLEIGSDQPDQLLALAARLLPDMAAAVFEDDAGLPRVLQLS